MYAPMSEPEEIVHAILSPSGSPEMFTISLSQFREVYRSVQQELGERQLPPTLLDIVLNGDWAVVQFSQLCNHRIRVLQDSSTGPLSRFLDKRILTEEDFDFASLHSEFHGARTYLSFRSFLKEEAATNWIPLALILLFSWAMFHFSFVTAGEDILEKVNELLLTATTLYLSIFLLFTVSQNIDLIKDPYYFRRGLTHRFLRVDQLLASLAVAALGVSILNIVLLNVSSPISIPLPGRIVVITNVSVLAPFLTAVGLIILIDCFLALIQYYFRRVRYILERELTKELLDQLANERMSMPDENGYGSEDIEGTGPRTA